MEEKNKMDAKKELKTTLDVPEELKPLYEELWSLRKDKEMTLKSDGSSTNKLQFYQNLHRINITKDELQEMINSEKKSEEEKNFILDDSEIPQQIDHALGQINIKGESKRYYGILIREKTLESTGANTSYQIRESPALVLENGRIISKKNNPLKTEFEFKTGMTIKDRWSLNSIKGFVKNQHKKTSFKEVYSEFKKFYEEGMVFENPTWYKLNALWDLTTYFQDLIDKYLIIKHEGVSGSAKSKGMKISANLSFNGRKFLCPNPANFFRYRHHNKAVIYIEEAERLFGDSKKKEDSELVEFINGSYEKGNFVPRQNDKDINKTDEFDPAGFSRIGSIKPLQGALKKRTITIHMIKAKSGDKRGDIEIPPETDSRYSEARNKAYINGLTNYQQYIKALSEIKNNYGLANREWQVSKPIIAMASCIDSNLEQEIGKFLSKSFQTRDDSFDETSWSVQFVFSLIDEIISTDNAGFISGNEYSARFRNKTHNENMSQRAITNIAQEIGFAEYYGRTSGGKQRGLKVGFEELVEIVLRNQIMSIQDLINYVSQESQESQINKNKYIKLLEAKIKNSNCDTSVTQTKQESQICDASDGLTLVSGVEGSELNSYEEFVVEENASNSHDDSSTPFVLEGDEDSIKPHSRSLSSSSFSSSEILDYIKSFDGRTTEQVITKFGDDAEGFLTKMKSQGDLFEQKSGFWKILE